MSGLFSFLTSVCAACIFIGALQMLLPESGVSKTISYVLSLVFLVSVISAAGITVKSWDFKFSSSASCEIDSEELQISSAKYVYATALTSAGINFEEITLYTDKLPDGSISINKISIRSDAEADKINRALSEVAKNIEVETVNE